MILIGNIQLLPDNYAQELETGEVNQTTLDHVSVVVWLLGLCVITLLLADSICYLLWELAKYNFRFSMYYIV